VLSNVPTDVSLSMPSTPGLTLSGPTLVGTTDDYTITTSGQPLSVMPEVDVLAPSGQSTNFNLGITAFSDEPHSAEVSSSTSQNIAIDNSTATETPDFTTTGQNIWGPDNAFNFDFNKFLGIGTTGGPAHLGGNIGGVTTVLGVKFGATAHGSVTLKAGLSVALNINGGSFNANLPFNVTLDDTYNKTTGALEVDESDSAGTGSINTTGPGGNFSRAAIFEAMASVGAGIFPIPGGFDITIPEFGGKTTLVKG
jgi:hypothetical protein